MKKIIKYASCFLGCLLILSIIIVLVSAFMYSPEYIYRIIKNGESKTSDYLFFPERIIAESSVPYNYTYMIDDSIGEMEIKYDDSKHRSQVSSLLKMLQENGTTSFIVIYNDNIVFEEYLNGNTKDSINTSFSSVKSLVSLMIGMAIEDGYIESVNQSISDYLPEFVDTEFETITIEDLLLMRSNIRYEEGFLWFTDDAKTYYMPDLRDLALQHMQINPKYAGQFHYNNYHPLLLGIILERSTGLNVSDYFQRKIWEKIGSQDTASWSLDSRKTGFEKMESGLNFKTIDYAKIGSMLLHNGNWNGYNIIGKEWLAVSTVAPEPLSKSELEDYSLEGINVGYRYMWYSTENGKNGYDFYSAGKYGQYIYISPENKTVIIRTGSSTGNVFWWPDIFKQIASDIDISRSLIVD